jgi:PAS domain S-box-containing protein
MTKKQLISEILRSGNQPAEGLELGLQSSEPGSGFYSLIGNRIDILAESLKLGLIGIWFNDLINNKLHWSDEVFLIFGVDQAEFSPSIENFLDSVFPDDRKMVEDAQKNSIAGNLDTYVIKHRVVRKKSNEIIHVIERCIHTRSKDGTITGSIGTIQDISDLRTTELRLTEKNRSMDILLNNLNGVVYRCKNDPDWTMEFISQGIRDLTGYEPDDLLAKKTISFNDLIWEEDRRMVWNEIQKAIELKLHYTLEYRIKTKEQKTKWVWEKGRAVFENDTLTGLEGFITDITDRKSAEEKLFESELHFRDLADSGEALIWTSGIDKKCNYFNKNWMNFTGRSLEQELGDGWVEGVHPDDLNLCLDIYVTAFDKREKFRMDYRLRHNDGTYHWIQDEGAPRFDKEGKFIGYMGHCIDISQRIMQHELLLRKEKDYRLLFEENPHAMLISDLVTFKIMEANAAALVLYGYSREEFLTLKLDDIRPPEDIALFHKIHKESSPHLGKVLEIRHKRKNGEIFWAEISYYEIEYKGRNARNISISDITISKEREIKLRESEDNYRLMFEAMTQGVVYQSANGEIISANRAAEKILGLSSDQMRGLSSIDSRWNAIREDGMPFPGGEHPSMEALRTGEPVSEVIMGILNPVSHGTTWIKVCAVPQFKQGSKHPYQVFTTIEDITEKKMQDDKIRQININLEEMVKQRTAELETFFSVSLDLLCIADFEGNFVKVNKAWEKLLGYTLAELEDQPFLDFVHPDDIEDTSNVMSKLTSGNPIQAFTNRYKAREGDYRFIEWTGVPVGKLIYAAARDVTGRIKSEEELRKARAGAEEANLAKSQFLANMSHEIRTPMNAILGYSELLESLVRDPIQKEFLNSIRTSGKTLLTLINDILDLSKIEAGKLDLDPEIINSASFFNEFGKIFAFRVKEKGLAFRTNIHKNVPEYIYEDGTRLRQIIMNLLGNSVKFTEKGEIALGISAETDKDTGNPSSIIIEIADTGIGIPPEFQEKIFNSFYQVKSKYSQSGTGLGLAITARLITLMNGSLWLESEPGKGSKFFIKLACMPLPEYAFKERSQIQIDPDAIHFTQATVLIVDDVAENRNFIKDALRNSEIELIEAADGCKALECRQLYRADLVITDIKMPNMDGYELHSCLKKRKETTNIPVIAYSASVMKKDQEELKNLFDGLLIKPLMVSDLYRELMRFLTYTIARQQPFQEEASEEYSRSQVIDFDMMIGLLTGEIESDWKLLEKRQPIRTVRSFGEKIVNVAHDHKCLPLERYGREIVMAADTFNIETILTLLKRYPFLVSELINEQ